MWLYNRIIRLIIILSRRSIITISDKTYLSLMFKYRLNYSLNLENPSSFNEKLQWLKLNDRNCFYPNMVDKYEAKKYIVDSIGDKIVIPTLGIYDNWDDINFDFLPDKFVIKATHDSGGIVICNDKSKFDFKLAKNKINKSLKRNYYCYGREWPYKMIKPRILIEKFMIDDSTNELRDYKFFCFNGKVKVFKVDFDRFTNHRANYYDCDKALLGFGEAAYPPDYNKKITFSKNLDKMIDLAQELSKDIPFVRIDFYDVNGKIYFGEFTFYPASGFGRFEPPEWDLKLGDYLQLPKKL